jgi:hypothetical protein
MRILAVVMVLCACSESKDTKGPAKEPPKEAGNPGVPPADRSARPAPGSSVSAGAGATSREELITRAFDALRRQDREAMLSLMASATACPALLPEDRDKILEGYGYCSTVKWPTGNGEVSADTARDAHPGCKEATMHADIDAAQSVDGTTIFMTLDDPFELDGRWYFSEISCGERRVKE